MPLYELIVRNMRHIRANDDRTQSHTPCYGIRAESGWGSPYVAGAVRGFGRSSGITVVRLF